MRLAERLSVASLVLTSLTLGCTGIVTTAHVKDLHLVHVEAVRATGSSPAQDADVAAPAPIVAFPRGADGSLYWEAPATARRAAITLAMTDNTIRVTRWDDNCLDCATAIVGPENLRLVEPLGQYMSRPREVPDLHFVTPLTNVSDVREKRVSPCHGGAWPILCGTIALFAASLAVLSAEEVFSPHRQHSAPSDIFFASTLALGSIGFVGFSGAVLLPDSEERILYQEH